MIYNLFRESFDSIRFPSKVVFRWDFNQNSWKRCEPSQASIITTVLKLTFYKNFLTFEKKLVDLDQSLHTKELRVINQRNVFSDKISSLERALEEKNKELENQKILEQRLTLFESRIKDNDSEISRQKKYDERINALEKQLEKTTLDLFIKNTTLEKRSAALQEQLTDKSLSDRLSSLEQELDPKKVGGITINTIKPMKVFDEANNQQSSDMQENAQPFEIDEITKVVDDAQPFEIDEITKINDGDESQSTKKKIEEKQPSAEIHEDDDDTARIGRSGDPLKFKKT